MFVYLMKNQRNKYYKIGRSRNPVFREKTLQAEEPEVDLILYVPALEQLEEELHTKFNHRRLRGEWFALEYEDVNDIFQAFIDTKAPIYLGKNYAPVEAIG